MRNTGIAFSFVYDVISLLRVYECEYDLNKANKKKGKSHDRGSGLPSATWWWPIGKVAPHSPPHFHPKEATNSRRVLMCGVLSRRDRQLALVAFDDRYQLAQIFAAKLWCRCFRNLDGLAAVAGGHQKSLESSLIPPASVFTLPPPQLHVPLKPQVMQYEGVMRRGSLFWTAPVIADRLQKAAYASMAFQPRLSPRV